MFDDKYFQLGDWRRQGCLPMALDEQLHFFLHKPERLLIEESLKLKYPEILVKLHVARLGRENKIVNLFQRYLVPPHNSSADNLPYVKLTEKYHKISTDLTRTPCV